MQDKRTDDLAAPAGKLYFTISEVSQLCGVKPHVLRYWETEFPSLRPRKGRGGSRRYRRRDIEEIQTIKSLLHEQGYRIAGARRHLAQRQRGASGQDHEAPQLALPFAALDRSRQLAMIRAEVAEILELVRGLEGRRRRSAEG